MFLAEGQEIHCQEAHSLVGQSCFVKQSKIKKVRLKPKSGNRIGTFRIELIVFTV